MSLVVSFRPLARAEYVEAIAWYDVQQPGLGSQFEAGVETALAAAAAHPDRSPLVTPDIRETSVARFPYAIY